MPFAKLGKNQYGDNDWNQFAAYGFSGGINIKSAPQDLDDGDLTSAVNVYLRSDGGIEQRLGYSSVNGPLTLVPAQVGGVTTLNTSGAVRFNQQVVNGSPLGSIKKWLLQQYDGGRYLIDATTGTTPTGVTNPVFSAGTQPWTTAKIYDSNGGTARTSGGGIGYGAGDTLIIAGDPAGPWFWDGVHQPYTATVASGTTPAIGTVALGAKYVQVVNNIVWFAGIPTQPNLVVASSLYVSTIAGTGPEYYQASFAMSAPVTGLGIIGSGAQAALVVGMQSGLSLLYGTYPNNYTQQDIPTNDGPFSYRCMLSIYGQFFYLGRQAFYVFDGQSAPQRLSDKVEPWILGNVNATAPSYAMQGDRTQYWMFYYNNRIHIVYDSTGSGLLGTWLVFDLINSGWTIQQPADAVIAYAALDGPGDPAPTVGVIFCQSNGNQYFWDQYSTGVMTADQYNGTTGANIQAGFSTKFFKVGTPGTPKRIMRFYPEFFAGNLNATCTITNDYGASSVASAVNVLSNNSYYNNTASQTINGGVGYGYALWSSGTRTFVGAPTTRIDTNLQGEAFSFGASTNAQTQPWIFQGMTGNYAQEARV